MRNHSSCQNGVSVSCLWHKKFKVGLLAQCDIMQEPVLVEWTLRKPSNRVTGWDTISKKDKPLLRMDCFLWKCILPFPSWKGFNTISLSLGGGSLQVMVQYWGFGWSLLLPSIAVATDKSAWVRQSPIFWVLHNLHLSHLCYSTQALTDE